MFIKKSKASTMSQYFSAFTLAEVLITLGIIGVVAALTIPALVANYQKNVYITQLKKSYTTFSQALTQLTAGNNCPGDLKCTGLFNAADSTTATQNFGDELVKYLKISKNCKMATDGSCWTKAMSAYYDGIGSRYDAGLNPGAYKFTTLDGQAVMFMADNNCPSYASGDLSQSCGELDIDVNGPNKGPNNAGVDIFYFYVTNGKGAKLIPFGGVPNYYSWVSNTGTIQGCYPGDTNGMPCAGRIISEGWQMNYYGTHTTVTTCPEGCSGTYPMCSCG